MPNTYTQIYIQLVFATKGRENKIRSEFREEIEKYITGIFTNKEQKIIAIYLNPDHIHIFFQLQKFKNWYSRFGKGGEN
ncbi:transposase [Kaistella sp.]|uniref:transposase n=1 Tax=Kaistella sp. TaxID=2782235 RepID=UPI00359FF09E